MSDTTNNFIENINQSNSELREMLKNFLSENRDPNIQEKIAIMQNIQKSTFMIHEQLISLSNKLLNSSIILDKEDEEILKLVIGNRSIH